MKKEDSRRTSSHQEMNKKIKAKARDTLLLLLLLLLSSWFCSSDFEDKGVFSTAQKSRLCREESVKTKPAATLQTKRYRRYKSTKYYNGNEDKVVHIDANAVTTIDDDDDDGEKKKKEKKDKKLSTK